MAGNMTETTQKKAPKALAALAVEKKKRARARPAAKRKEKTEIFIATVAEMPVSADIARAGDKQIQATAMESGETARAWREGGISATPSRAAPGEEVTVESLAKYFERLKRELSLPFIATGVKAFGWERLYVWQIGDPARHEELKTKNPSFTDRFEVVGFEEDFDEFTGIVARALRLSDKREFFLPLCDLRATDEGRNAELLSEYCEWFMK